MISGTFGRCFPLYPSYHHLSRRSWNPPSKSSPKCSQTLDAPGWIPHSSNQKISKHPHKNYHGGAYWGMGFYLPKNLRSLWDPPSLATFELQHRDLHKHKDGPCCLKSVCRDGYGSKPNRMWIKIISSPSIQQPPCVQKVPSVDPLLNLVFGWRAD